jgi:hypothetical protein
VVSEHDVAKMEKKEKNRDTGKRGQLTNRSFTEWHNREMYIRVNGISQ